MASLLEEKSPTKAGWKLTVILISVYLWWLVTTPEYSNKFAFLATIRFERILVFVILLAILIGGKVRSRNSRMTALIITFFVWATISYVVSPYSDFPKAQIWFSNYWKLIVFYFLVLYSIEDMEDLRRVFLAYAFICFSYQLYSWFDFSRGGSYVWQQGIKRIVGAWSGGGEGAPNAFGLLGVFSIPLAVFLIKTEGRKLILGMAWALLVMSVASVMFSGTRGAFLTLLILVVIYYRQRIMHPKRLIIVAVVIGIVILIIPNDLKHRYFGLIIYDQTSIESRWDKSAAESAEGRIQGIEDGWKLFLRRPLIGYGPATSSVARLEVRDLRSDRGEIINVELHNLYAQLISETGLPGTLVFSTIIIIYLRQLNALQHGVGAIEQASLIQVQAQLLFYLMLVVLVYGMVSHTLYKYYWFFLFACQVTLVSISERSDLTGGKSAKPNINKVLPNV